MKAPTKAKRWPAVWGGRAGVKEEVGKGMVRERIRLGIREKQGRWLGCQSWS